MERITEESQEQFDPYYLWLGIPPAEQPPNHYRLLGIPPFEKNPNVIGNAADRQMAHLRTFQTGKHSTLSQKLLNEVARARICLLNAEKKLEYDRELHDKSVVVVEMQGSVRQAIEPYQPSPPLQAAEAPDEAAFFRTIIDAPLESTKKGNGSAARIQNGQKETWKRINPYIVAGAVAAGTAMIGGVAVLSTTGKKGREQNGKKAHKMTEKDLAATTHSMPKAKLKEEVQPFEPTSPSGQRGVGPAASSEHHDATPAQSIKIPEAIPAQQSPTEKRVPKPIELPLPEPPKSQPAPAAPTPPNVVEPVRVATNIPSKPPLAPAMDEQELARKVQKRLLPLAAQHAHLNAAAVDALIPTARDIVDKNALNILSTMKRQYEKDGEWEREFMRSKLPRSKQSQWDRHHDQAWKLSGKFSEADIAALERMRADASKLEASGNPQYAHIYYRMMHHSCFYSARNEEEDFIRQNGLALEGMRRTKEAMVKQWGDIADANAAVIDVTTLPLSGFTASTVYAQGKMTVKANQAYTMKKPLFKGEQPKRFICLHAPGQVRIDLSDLPPSDYVFETILHLSDNARDKSDGIIWTISLIEGDMITTSGMTSQNMHTHNYKISIRGARAILISVGPGSLNNSENDVGLIVEPTLRRVR